MKERYKLYDYTIIDMETGEIKGGSEIDEEYRAVLMQVGSRVLTPKQIEYLAKKESRVGDKTPFVWNFFNYGEMYFSKIKDVNIPRMIFFATFCNDSGYVMANSDIRDMLKINDNQLKEFRDELSSGKIISIKEDKVYISSKAFKIGALEEIHMDFIRLFSKANRDLYQSCRITEHKQLSYIYRMIPYLNRQTNILSNNPNEQDIDHVEYITFKDFCDKVGYDSSHSSRLRKALSKFRIYGELVVGFFDNISRLSPNGKYVVVNPRLFFGGERKQKGHQVISKLFFEEKRLNKADNP